MKRMVVLLSLVGLLLGSGVMSQKWLHGYTGSLKSQMEELSQAVQHGENVKYEIRAIRADWTRYQQWLGAEAHEDKLDQLEVHIKRAEMLAGFPDSDVYRRELVLELLEVGDAAEELWEKERLSLQNIL